MRSSGHVIQADRIDLLAEGAVACAALEAVLEPHNNPAEFSSSMNREHIAAYKRLLKTTPNPNATKDRRCKLLPPPPLHSPGMDKAALGPGDLEVCRSGNVIVGTMSAVRGASLVAC